MTLPSIITPIASGIFLGLIYGYSFVAQQRSIFFPEVLAFLVFHHSSFFPLRIIFFVLTWYYLLRSPILHSILMMIICMVIFWLVILNTKTQLYEQRTSFRNSTSMVTRFFSWLRTSIAGTK